MRRLIVNADDLGMTAGINRAIVEGSEKGIVTSATLMATSRAFDDAVRQVRGLQQRQPSYSVGCHVVLMDGEPVLPAERVSSLLQPGSSDGSKELRNELVDFAGCALTGRLKPEEIEAEADAQFQRIHAAGVEPSHFDCHKHAHMFPAVLVPLLNAAKARGVRAVRNPFGMLIAGPFSQLVRYPKLWRRLAELGLLRSFRTRFLREVKARGLRTTDGTVGVLATGTLDLRCFAEIVESLPEGTWEFVCHPGYNDADLDRVRTRLRQSREQELAVLTSPEARAALQRSGVELISYHDL